MKKIANPSYQQQEIVNTYFQSQSALWKDIYESNEVYAEKQRNRYATKLAWEEPELAIQEMARVTKSGGYLILTADNRAQLNILLDPCLNPALAPFKQRVMKDALDRPGLRRKSLDDLVATSHSWHFIDLSLKRVELVKTRSTTLGFGPFLIPSSYDPPIHSA